MRVEVTKSDFLVLLGVTIWGMIPPILKYSLREIDPLAFATVRMFLATALLVALVWLWERRLAVRREEWVRVVLVAITGTTLYQIFFLSGLGRTTASNSSLLIATAPIFTLFFVALLGEERITPSQIGGILLSLVGVSMVIGAAQGGFSWGRDSLRGDLLILVAAVFEGLSMVLARRPLSRHSVLQMAVIFNGLGTLALLPVGAAPIISQPWAEISTAAWLGLGYGAFISIPIGYMCWYKGIADLGPTRTAAYSYLIPVIAVGTSVLTLGERFTTLQGIGALVIFAGIALTRLAPKKAVIDLRKEELAMETTDEEKAHQSGEGGCHGEERS